MRYRFTVSFNAPESDRERVRQYVEEAIEMWGKQYNPGQPENGFEDRDLLFDVLNIKVSK